MSDFKLEVGMFVRVGGGDILIVCRNDKCVNLRNLHTYTLGVVTRENYEVSNTYDFKEIIYSNIKKELLTEEEKEIVRKWVDVVGREEVTDIFFNRFESLTKFEIHTNNSWTRSIDYKDKFKNVELDKEYTLEELGL